MRPACSLPACALLAAAILVTGPGSLSVAAQSNGAPTASEPPKPSPEEKAARRLPQPVRVGYLIGLPVLDETNAILTRVGSVVRTREGKIQLVVSYGGLFGIGSRLVAMPVEVVAMLGRQVVAVDMPSAEFEMAPTYYGSGAEALDPDTVIRVGVMRR